ncbi:MAG: response regulator [Phycisphaerae bacterium]|nr:response regulator [Phycisphaerae bacterium]
MSEDTPSEPSEKRVFTTGEAAALCKVSQQTIIRCFDSGRLGGFRVPGSKFRRIPREELICFMRANGIATDALEGPGKRRVLIVDDDPQIAGALAELLARDPRFDLRVAGTGYEAGMLTESFRPHLVLLDYMLPDVNGTAVCRRIRARPELGPVKIVFVSGAVDRAEVQSLLDAGADEFIKKPFDVHHLLERVRGLLGMGAARTAIA